MNEQTVETSIETEFQPNEDDELKPNSCISKPKPKPNPE